MLKSLIKFALVCTLLAESLTPNGLSSSDKPKALIKQEQQDEARIRSEQKQMELIAQIKSYLEKKGSPFADVTPYLLKQKHWRLAIGISAIESQFCTKKLYLNCWGIGGDSAYRHYNSLEEGIEDFDNLIERRQARGKWLTVESMNCSYVVPCNRNWVRVVNSTLKDLDEIISRTME